MFGGKTEPPSRFNVDLRSPLKMCTSSQPHSPPKSLTESPLGRKIPSAGSFYWSITSSSQLCVLLERIRMSPPSPGCEISRERLGLSVARFPKRKPSTGVPLKPFIGTQSGTNQTPSKGLSMVKEEKTLRGLGERKTLRGSAIVRRGHAVVY